ncbi:hypothetical protein Tco_1413692 [Tanacetum coccineum]
MGVTLSGSQGLSSPKQTATGPNRLASPRVNGYLVKASSNPFTFYDSPLPGVNHFAAAVFVDVSILQVLKTEDLCRKLEVNYVKFQFRGGLLGLRPTNDLSDDSVAKFTAIGFDCLLSLDEQICLDELEKTLKQIEPYNSRRPALDDIRNLIYQRTVHERNLKANMAEHPFDERYKLVPRKMSFFKAIQPKKPPPKRARNVGKSKRPQLTTSSSTESPPSDNKELPTTKLSPRSYSRALTDDPNMSKE